jgi:phosphoribosylglycinamide formyltransferase-1
VKVGVLASGEGTNLQALLDAGTDLVAVASDKPAARALERAQVAGVPTAVFPRDEYDDRVARDLAIADWLDARGVELVVLAGYMSLLDAAFIARFPDRVLNIHPSLLPAFPGLHPIQDALDYGVKVFGVTVHLVDEGVDTGPIVLQGALEAPRARTVEDVLAQLRPLEHALLPEAVALMAAGRVHRDPEHHRRMLIAP